MPLVGPDGQQVQTITLKDPEDIKASIADPNADLTRECIIPLLLDIRNLLTAALGSMNSMMKMMNAGIQLANKIRENTDRTDELKTQMLIGGGR